MNRRAFCRIASLALLAGAAPDALALQREIKRPPTASCRVTVLRRQCFSDLQSQYLDEPETGPCQALADGQTFTIDSSSQCPKGMCPKAWNSMLPEIQRLLSGDGSCGICGPHKHEAITCCGDGTRPVIFKIEILNC